MTDRQPTICVVDDEADVRSALRLLIRSMGYAVETFATPSEFLASWREDRPGCLVLDVRMPGMTGLQLQQELSRRGLRVPIVFISGHGDIPMAVRAVQAGAVDFLEKPFTDQALLDCIGRALARDAAERAQAAAKAALGGRLDELTPRERDVLGLLIDGAPNKLIARSLGLSTRTVEIHRARILAKMRVRNASELIKLLLESGIRIAGSPPPDGRVSNR
jgi:two-component system response regulator FixJ